MRYLIEEPGNALERLLVEIWVLKAILVRDKKEERRVIERASVS